MFNHQFEKCFKYKIEYIKQILFFTTFSYWILLLLDITPSKYKTKTRYNKILQAHDPKNNL